MIGNPLLFCYSTIMETITIFTDGSAKGNPGPSAIGVQMLGSNGKVILELSERIGNATNNFAEYQAVMRALQVAKDHFKEHTKDLHFEIKLASELVKKQLNNEEQINQPGLVPHFIEIHNMRVAAFPNITFTHVPRDLNNEANALVKEALDAA